MNEEKFEKLLDKFNNNQLSFFNIDRIPIQQPYTYVVLNIKMQEVFHAKIQMFDKNFVVFKKIFFGHFAIFLYMSVRMKSVTYLLNTINGLQRNFVSFQRKIFRP